MLMEIDHGARPVDEHRADEVFALASDHVAVAGCCEIYLVDYRARARLRVDRDHALTADAGRAREGHRQRRIDAHAARTRLREETRHRRREGAVICGTGAARAPGAACACRRACAAARATAADRPSA